MFSRNALTLAVCFAVLFGVTKTANSDPQAPAEPIATTPETALQKESELQEILRIRQKLGGSVLKGSFLEQTDQADIPFDAGLRDRLGLPAQKTKRGEQVTTPKQSVGQIVSTLRTQSSELDRIANEIEVLRAYKNADSLRETAKQLRLIARQFDTREKPSLRRRPEALTPQTSAAR